MLSFPKLWQRLEKGGTERSLTGSGEGSHSHPFTTPAHRLWHGMGTTELAGHTPSSPCISLSSCCTNDILHVVLSLSVEVDAFSDGKGNVPLTRQLWLVFPKFLCF